MIEIIKTKKDWQLALTNFKKYDFYHTFDFHKLSEDNGEGEPRLYLYENKNVKIALPLLLREIKFEGEIIRDVSSVYGYAGPILSTENLPSNDILTDFSNTLKKTLLERKILTAFSRLHPILKNQQIIQYLGETTPRGTTVSIDLTASLESQRADYRKDHKYDTNKLRRQGFTVEEGKQYLESFIEIYHQTMKILKATPYYYFSKKYFEDFLNSKDFETKLFVCKHENTPIAAGLFTLQNNLVQYHLSGTHPDYYKYSPMKLLLDEVRLWAYQKNAKYFHLGGGLGGNEDSLFKFKAGFSKNRHTFHIWKWIIDPIKYQKIKEKTFQILSEKKLPIDEHYFPIYRLIKK